jgi:hypothetical protein
MKVTIAITEGEGVTITGPDAPEVEKPKNPFEPAPPAAFTFDGKITPEEIQEAFTLLPFILQLIRQLRGGK